MGTVCMSESKLSLMNKYKDLKTKRDLKPHVSKDVDPNSPYLTFNRRDCNFVPDPIHLQSYFKFPEQDGFYSIVMENPQPDIGLDFLWYLNLIQAENARNIYDETRFELGNIEAEKSGYYIKMIDNPNFPMEQYWCVCLNGESFDLNYLIYQKLEIYFDDCIMFYTLDKDKII